MCPFVNCSNPRCATHLTLANLISAFVHCADRYAECPVYRELIALRGDHEHDRGSSVVLAAS